MAITCPESKMVCTREAYLALAAARVSPVGVGGFCAAADGAEGGALLCLPGLGQALRWLGAGAVWWGWSGPASPASTGP